MNTYTRYNAIKNKWVNKNTERYRFNSKASMEHTINTDQESSTPIDTYLMQCHSAGTLRNTITMLSATQYNNSQARYNIPIQYRVPLYSQLIGTLPIQYQVPLYPITHRHVTTYQYNTKCHSIQQPLGTLQHTNTISSATSLIQQNKAHDIK